jgi:hypothetical protein
MALAIACSNLLLTSSLASFQYALLVALFKFPARYLQYVLQYLARERAGLEKYAIYLYIKKKKKRKKMEMKGKEKENVIK